ncbi:hypothetical protein CYJ10_12470 [Cupriavidus pauculus]|uniref:Transmembrane protein n=1 Tax=Cupriavidus pauculus TaxID=82633 RepID=A0A2N5CE39_9BURK|nr:hypothetical protein CYJ10_12470 [Cupriavidus pauculus]
MTSFNFSANGKREYAVSIADRVSLRDGMTVTALLEEPDNWHTLRGWIDHETGRIAGTGSPAWHLWTALTCVLPFAFLPFYVMPFFGVGEWPSEQWWFWTLPTIFGLLALQHIRWAWKARKRMAILRRFGTYPDSKPNNMYADERR